MASSNKLLIIGASDAGVSAAIRAREIREDLEIVLISSDAHPHFSVCGLPFYLSGLVPDWRQLAHHTVKELTDRNILVKTNCRAQHIDPRRHIVTLACVETDSREEQIGYDRLIFATGAVPRRPFAQGTWSERVRPLHTREDALAVQQQLQTVRSAAIIGGGFIGMEMAEAFRQRGIAVTIFQRSGHVLSDFDAELSKEVENICARQQIAVQTLSAVDGVKEFSSQVRLYEKQREIWQGDLVLVAAGVQPQTALAADAGIQTDSRGAIVVDRYMQTNQADIWAAGDCTSTWHRLREEFVYLPLGTTAHKQGQVAGENAAGGSAAFAGSMGTQVLKFFDYAVARTGLTGQEAGPLARTVLWEGWDRNAYYPQAQPLRILLTGHASTGRILGAQMIGNISTSAAQRIDLIANALFYHATIPDILQWDLSYSPPFSSPWDPLQQAAQHWMRRAASVKAETPHVRIRKISDLR
ncbi:MAG: FAD-dependent oxidoreductase [Firmicutes bacterium]|nr:FAD-dependent oxidoreductase [Bacillota bacterium]